MEELLRSRLREAIAESGLIIKEIASMAHVNRRTLEGWVGKRGSRANVVDFVRVARVLRRPVEWFVDENYEPTFIPRRLGNLVEQIDSLSDDDLAIVRDLVQSLVARRNVKSETTQRAAEV